jgi:alcohol dehydrogenase class IV
MNFEFATATRILFGSGRRFELFAAANAFGRKGLLVTGANPERSDWIRAQANSLELQTLAIATEPSLDLVDAAARSAREFGAQFVISIGGGSVIDAGKAIAALATNTRPILDYLEIIGAAQPLAARPLPFIALPTTAGTGAEVTRNAVLGSPADRLKVSLRGSQMLPALAIVDPDLARGLPPALTASTGMDALTQLIEPFLSTRANPVTDAICREAIPRAARALPRAFANDTEARVEMSLASLFGGLALANAGLGAVHGFAAPIGGMFSAPHGAVCAALLPHALAVNLQALQERSPNSRALDRFQELARLLTGHANATAADALSHVSSLCADLGIPALRAHGVTAADFPELVIRAAQASSMKSNPIALNSQELTEILARAT